MVQNEPNQSQAPLRAYDDSAKHSTRANERSAQKSQKTIGNDSFLGPSFEKLMKSVSIKPIRL
jgi:hypothetical protein